MSDDTTDDVDRAIRMLHAEAENDGPSAFSADVAIVLAEIDRLRTENAAIRTNVVKWTAHYVDSTLRGRPLRL